MNERGMIKRDTEGTNGQSNVNRPPRNRMEMYVECRWMSAQVAVTMTVPLLLHTAQCTPGHGKNTATMGDNGESRCHIHIEALHFILFFQLLIDGNAPSAACDPDRHCCWRVSDIVSHARSSPIMSNDITIKQNIVPIAYYLPFLHQCTAGMGTLAIVSVTVSLSVSASMSMSV